MDWSWVAIGIALIAGVVATNWTAAWKDVRMRQTEIMRHLVPERKDSDG
jgi:hypothetical protein